MLYWCIFYGFLYKDSKSVLHKKEDTFLQSVAPSLPSATSDDKKTRAVRNKRVLTSDEDEEMNADEPKRIDREVSSSVVVLEYEKVL